MLPFLAKKKESTAPGIIIKTRESDEKPEDQDDPNAGHEACGKAILAAIQANDASGLASAVLDLIALGDTADAEPHSYEAQNIEAGKDE